MDIANTKHRPDDPHVLAGERHCDPVEVANILIGALITKGTPPGRLYHAWLRGKIELATSTAQVRELADVLAPPRLQKFLDAAEASVIDENNRTRGAFPEESPSVSFPTDPTDNQILATAISGSGDLS